jgi:hypothetical protein
VIQREGNSTFPDPDKQVLWPGAGAQPFGSNGSAQYDAQQGRPNAFKRFQVRELSRRQTLLIARTIERRSLIEPAGA